MWSSEGSRKGVEGGQEKKAVEEGEKKGKKEGEKTGKKKEGEEGGSVMARGQDDEGSVVFRDFFTPFFAGRFVSE
jgi:hypothetical protein